MKRFDTSVFGLLLSLVTVVTSAYVPCILLCVNRASPRDLAEIKICLYKGPTLDDYTCVEIDNAVELLDEMDNSKPTAMYIHGWLGGEEQPSTQAILSAYLERGGHNVLFLNWKYIAEAEYLHALRSVEGVGYYNAAAINKMVKAGMNTTGLNLVGHSLGAHVAGATGRNMNSRLSRITGLDPAGPGFYSLLLQNRLASSDAEFVSAISSDKGVAGTILELGHANFYPNGGHPVQPGCTTELISADACSHYRSVYYYARTVKDDDLFDAKLCDSEEEFDAGDCDSNETIKMGYNTPATARGKFYLHIDGSTYPNITEVYLTEGNFIARFGKLITAI